MLSKELFFYYSSNFMFLLKIIKFVHLYNSRIVFSSSETARESAGKSVTQVKQYTRRDSTGLRDSLSDRPTTVHNFSVSSNVSNVLLGRKKINNVYFNFFFVQLTCSQGWVG